MQQQRFQQGRSEATISSFISHNNQLLEENEHLSAENEKKK